MDARKPIQSFRDLDVYQRSYNAMLVVAQKVLNDLPNREKFDLVDQSRDLYHVDEEIILRLVV